MESYPIYCLFPYKDYFFVFKLLNNTYYGLHFVNAKPNKKISSLFLFKNIKHIWYDELKDSINNCYFIDEFLYDAIKEECRNTIIESEHLRCAHKFLCEYYLNLIRNKYSKHLEKLVILR